MDQTAAVRVNARRAACQAAGSLHLAELPAVHARREHLQPLVQQLRLPLPLRTCNAR